MRAIDLLILGLISEKPRHGYDITREIASRGLRNWLKVSDVAVYKACARLERQGCLVSLSEKEGKGPERSVYQLTEGGRERLSDLLFEMMSSSDPIRNEFYLAFEFPGVLAPGEAQLALERRVESVSRLLAGRKARLEALSGLADELAVSVCRHEVEVYEGELAWLEGLAAQARGGSRG
jgi:DNA-binding PadR family transcriptional regulator